MQVVRLEHKMSGKGPFTHYSTKVDKFMWLDKGPMSMPCPWDDKLCKTSKELEDRLFGFPSEHIMCKWFKGRDFWEALAEEGFQVKYLDVNPEYAAASVNQVMFMKEHVFQHVTVALNDHNIDYFVSQGDRHA